jgi:hypothetical protein
MVAPKKKPAKAKKPEALPVYATPERLKEVNAEIHELETMLAEDAKRPQPKITDPDGVRAEILKKSQYVMRHSPPSFRGENANRAYREAKELAKFLQENMPKKSLYHQHYPKTSDSYSKQQKFEEGVRQQMQFMTDPKIKQAAIRYKYIMARLSGGDPHERNIERLRSGR